MYACIRGPGRRFFEGVCTLSHATSNFRDPPPPRYAIEPGSHCRDSGPEWITSRATVSVDLA